MKYLIILLLCSVQLIAQDTTITFFDLDWKEIETEVNAAYFRKAVENGDKVYFKDFYINGAIQSSGAFINDGQETEQGLFIYHFENGATQSKVHYENGLRKGEYLSFYENGKIKSKGQYVAGKMNGNWTWFHKNGEVSSKETYITDDLLNFNFYNDKGEELTAEKYIEYPTFQEGEKALIEYIRTNLEYPEQARENGVTGTPIIEFYVSESGEMIDFRIFRSIHPLLDEAALELVKSIPQKWNPGRAHNLPNQFSYKLPIKFELTD